MADAQQQDAAREEDAFIDESGKTSLQPEGAGAREPDPGAAPREPVPDWGFPDPLSKDRWEGDLSAKPEPDLNVPEQDVNEERDQTPA
jgi:hypothetical protein